MMLMIGAARRAGEGRKAGARAPVEGLEPGVHGGHAGHGQAARHPRHGPGRAASWRDGRAGSTCGSTITTFGRIQGSDEGVFHETLEDMLPHCDFLSLHCNVTPATRGLMNARRIRAAARRRHPGQRRARRPRRRRCARRGAEVGKAASRRDRRLQQRAQRRSAPRRRCPTRSSCRTSAAPRAETRDAMGFRALDNLDAFFAGREPGDRVA